MPRQLRAPGAREKKQLLRELESEGEVACSVVGDISKTHMGCQIDEEETIPDDPDSQLVYVNKVGTFGLSPASYWWTRIAACGIRATHHLLAPGYPLELLLYADDLESPLSYLFLAVLGYPFKWAKTRGGYCVEWLGMETDHTAANWLGEKSSSGKVAAKEMQQGLGRP